MLPPPQYCNGYGVHIDAHFEGGNFYRCSIDADGTAQIDIRPEDERINPSPWFALRVSSSRPQAVQLNFDFADDKARYWPKISYDGRHWQALDTGQVSFIDDRRRMTVSIPARRTVFWLAAQEVLTAGWYDDWLLEMADNDGIDVALLGSSVQGRPLMVASTANKPEFVVLLGRQHPPEVTGALAMRPFVQTVLGDTSLAVRFRERYQLLIAPLINPDGVALGHWRHNVEGIDLNRDWGPFTQPETAAFHALLQTHTSRGARPALMLDFHSTHNSLFYTQLPSDFATAPDFATSWLARSRLRLPDYEFSHEARARSTQANTKNWFFGTYGIPAITYEIGDEVARDDITRSSVVFAEEFMRLLLEAPLPY